MQSNRATFFSSPDERVTDNPTIANIVQDTDSGMTEPRNWRHTGLIQAAYQGDITGLETMWASTSAAPSAVSFDWIAAQIRTLTSDQARKMFIIDLRKESHAYFNGNTFTHATEHNWINRDKSDEAALAAETGWVEFIKTNPDIDNVLSPDQHKQFLWKDGKAIHVHSVMSEQEVAEAAGFEYKRFCVNDHMAPDPHVVDQYILFIKQLPSHSWVHLHCRGGEGRSSTFLAISDMMRNASHVTFDDIINRIASVPPYYKLDQMTRRCKELTVYYKERYAFLKEFYEYAKSLSLGNEDTWSNWVQSKFNSGNQPIAVLR